MKKSIQYFHIFVKDLCRILKDITDAPLFIRVEFSEPMDVQEIINILQSDGREIAVIIRMDQKHYPASMILIRPQEYRVHPDIARQVYRSIVDQPTAALEIMYTTYKAHATKSAGAYIAKHLRAAADWLSIPVVCKEIDLSGSI